MKLKGKVALITGGNSGIGLACAKLFKEEGAQVIITASSPNTFEQAKKEFGNQFDIVETDVRNLNSLDNLYDHIKRKYSGLDILFANAGIAKFISTTEVDEDFYDTQFDINVRGLYFTVAKAIPLLKPNSSVILNASAVSTKGFAGASVYAATKAAVRSLARSWTAEFLDQIRFNTVSAGAIETPLFGKAGMSEDELKELVEHVVASTPAKRFGTAREVANLVLFLASDDSSYSYGADYATDGGFAQV